MTKYDYREVRDFRKHGEADVARVSQTRRPLVLTTKGKPEAVMHDIESFQQMLEKLQEARSILAESDNQDA